MRNAMPMRWIEQREERQVLATARFERAPKAPWAGMSGEVAPQWLPRLGSWLAARHPMGCPVAQLQPVLIRQAGRPQSGGGNDEGYSCYW